jgi:hypothetical protein
MQRVEECLAHEPDKWLQVIIGVCLFQRQQYSPFSANLSHSRFSLIAGEDTAVVGTARQQFFMCPLIYQFPLF